MKKFNIKTKLLTSFFLLSIVASIPGILGCFWIESPLILGTCIALILLSLFLSIAIAFYLAKSIAYPLEACANRLELLAEGDLHTPVPDIHSHDETGLLAHSTKMIVEKLYTIIDDEEKLLTQIGEGNFNIRSNCHDYYINDFKPLLSSIKKICIKLNQTMSSIHNSAHEVDISSSQVASDSRALSEGAIEQAGSIQELAATINSISEHISQTSESAKTADQLITHVGQELNSSNQHMREMIHAMDEIDKSSNEVKKIIKTIEDIAFQTNILALNAAVEAARAGYAGKGFAVVADEVRNLAIKSQEAAKDTTSLIETSITAIKAGAEIADTTAMSMSQVVVDANDVISLIATITDATKAQSDSISQVTHGIEQISNVVQNNSATAKEEAIASEHLSQQAGFLKELIAKFNLHSKYTSVQMSNTPEQEYLNNTNKTSFNDKY